MISQTLSDFFDKLYRRNFYFPVQFIFAWLFFKILGLIKIVFWLRIFLAFFLLLFLVFSWQYFVLFIFQNVFFQYYLHFFYLLQNFLTPNIIAMRFVGFFLGSFSFLFEPHKITFEEFYIYLPNLNYLFFVLLLFNFFKRFNNNVVIPTIANGLGYGNNFNFKSMHFFYWEDLIELLQCYFNYQYSIKSKVFFLREISYQHFPLSYIYMDFFREEKLFKSHSRSLIKDAVNKIAVISTESEKEKTIEEYSEKFSEYSEKRRKILQEASHIASGLNTNFYWFIVQGLLLGACVAFCLLNF